MRKPKLEPWPQWIKDSIAKNHGPLPPPARRINVLNSVSESKAHSEPLLSDTFANIANAAATAKLDDALTTSVLAGGVPSAPRGAPGRVRSFIAKLGVLISCFRKQPKQKATVTLNPGPPSQPQKQIMTNPTTYDTEVRVLILHPVQFLKQHYAAGVEARFSLSELATLRRSSKVRILSNHPPAQTDSERGSPSGSPSNALGFMR